MSLLELVNAVVELVKDEPEIVAAVKGVFDAIDGSHDTTPAFMHLQIVLAAKGLGLDPTKV